MLSTRAAIIGLCQAMSRQFGTFNTSVPAWPKGNQSAMNNSQPNNPLHGITLEMIVNELVAFYGWQELGQLIDIRCFNYEPSVASSLKFLRRTPWARERVELLYAHMQWQKTEPPTTR